MNRKGLILIGVGVVLLVIGAILLENTLNSLASNWAYKMTGIRNVQGDDLDGSGIVVAIVDTGIDTGHPSLDHIPIKAWKDYVNDRPKPYDDAGHGSHVAGVLAGDGTTFGGKLQGFNMRGAAPGVGLVVVKAIDKDGSGTGEDVADGITFAVQQRVDIICLSLGSKAQLVTVGDEITNAVNSATNQGILVVAAAGNTGDDPSRNDVESPASIDRVIAVGAVDDNKKVTSFSAEGDSDKNYGVAGIGSLATRHPPNQKPEIVAPGDDIQSAWTGGAYVRADGTSQAAPFVCGALALLLQKEPTLRSDNSGGMVDQVKRALMDSAEHLKGYREPHDPVAGYGLLRADRLLAEF